jgi:putative SOS response-associated peptidase YedK
MACERITLARFCTGPRWDQEPTVVDHPLQVPLPRFVVPPDEFSKVRWGLIPSWSKEAGVGDKMINARSETVADKPAFQDAFRTRRCLIPADGFYEWVGSNKAKQPFHFGLMDDSLFAFAGICLGVGRFAQHNGVLWGVSCKRDVEYPVVHSRRSGF